MSSFVASAAADPIRAIELQSCKLEAKARSSTSSSKLSANFDLTNTLDDSIKVYWIDFDGRRQHYMDLAPGETLTQPTFVRHWWLIVRNEGGQPCVGIFQAVAGNAQVTLSAPID